MANHTDGNAHDQGCRSSDTRESIEAMFQIKNILIEKNGANYFLEQTMQFTTIDALFDHYRRNDLINQSKEKMRLIRPVGLLSWEYKHSQIMCVKKVGQGAYGEVYKGKVKKGTKTFDAAIKAVSYEVLSLF